MAAIGNLQAATPAAFQDDLNVHTDDEDESRFFWLSNRIRFISGGFSG